MSTSVFVDPEISTQADGAQSPRVPVPYPEDPYKAIRQAYLVETDTESEPFEDLVETETPESPYIAASPTSLPDSTPPTRHAEESEGSDTSDARSTPSDFTVPLSPDHPLTHTTPTLVSFLRRTIHMAVCVPPAMSSSLSASIAEVAAMFDSAFRKRFRSSYESSPSSSPPDLPSRKRSRGTSDLVEDDKDEDEEDEDEEIEESSDFESESEDTEDKGPTAKDEGPAAGDGGLAAGDKGPAVGEPLGLGYRALRRREIALREGQMPSVFEVGQGSGSVPEPERPERVSALSHTLLWIVPEGGNEYSLKDKNQAKTDKTEHGNRKSVKSQKVKVLCQGVVKLLVKVLRRLHHIADWLEGLGCVHNPDSPPVLSPWPSSTMFSSPCSLPRHYYTMWSIPHSYKSHHGGDDSAHQFGSLMHPTGQQKRSKKHEPRW
ncbi:hypothetical protein Tco_0429006 [Tanacetum coccineum]